MTTINRLLLTILISFSTIMASGQNYITERQFADKLNSKNKFYAENSIVPDIFGIIALTSEQAKMLHDGGVFFTPGNKHI